MEIAKSSFIKLTNFVEIFGELSYCKFSGTLAVTV